MAKIGYGGLDRFRLAAALLVIANHTGPLVSYSAAADFLLTGIVARLANAFFFMASGYFFFGRLQGEKRQDRAALRKFLARLGLFYATGMALYVPLNVYTGYFRKNGPLAIAKDVVFNGTFYHLWYLPAVMLGMCIVYALHASLPRRLTLAATAVLYAIGLLGDSEYGLISRSEALSSFYDVLFHVFDYTRNGLFFAPLYIALGALAARRRLRPRFGWGYAAGASASLALLLAEGWALHAARFPRHDSMYVFMAPTAYALFRLLLFWGGAGRRTLRSVCAWMYLLHPLAIVALRGIAVRIGLPPVLRWDSLVYFAVVSALSALLAAAVVGLDGVRRGRKRNGGARASGLVAGGKAAAAIRTVRRRLRGEPLVPARAWAEIDLACVEHNWRALAEALPAGTRMMAVVKADGYGHGAVPVARRLYRAGARHFAVADVDEGVALRRGGVQGDILVLGRTPTERLDDAVRCRLALTVADAEDAERLQASGRKLDVHVKIDTGMNRLGERGDRAEQLLSIYRHSRLRVLGTFSHLAAADGAGPEAIAFTRAQIDRFDRAVALIRAAGFDPGLLHLQSSYGILNYPELSYDLARPGIALYGLLGSERDKQAAGIDLLPALALKATVTRVRSVRAGENIGYGLAYAAPRDGVVATVSIGYADGVPRELSERGGCILVRGRRARIVGRICMDQLMADVTGIGDVRPGETVTLIGADCEERITVEEVAGRTGTIANETVAGLGARVARRYV